MKKQPNIIFYFSDQQRFDTAGCYGQKLPVTPRLDELAEEGALFTNAFTCQPVCGPARACLQTGQYAAQLGCYRNAIALPQNVKHLATCLKEAGYETGYVGKWHLASTLGNSHEMLEPEADFEAKAIPEDRRGGYTDYWVAADVLEATSHGYGGRLFDAQNREILFDGYRTDAVTDHALDFLRSRRGEKPFFLFLSHLEPHHQNDHDRFEGPEGCRQKFAGFEAPKDLENAPGDWNANWREQYPDYLGCCRKIDENLGRLIDALKETGHDEDTVVIFTSDHGSHFRTRCMEYKRSCHEDSIHVPLVIWNGPFEKGRRYEDLVSLIDLPPTILSIAGAAIPETMQGRPLTDLLAEGASWQQEVFLQISESQVGRAIRTDRYKYSVRAYDKNPWLDSGSGVYHEEYLYDLESDPYECSNLVRDPAYEKVRKELRERLILRMTAAGENAPEILPALPPSTVDLGLNGTLGDFFSNERSRDLAEKHFGEWKKDPRFPQRRRLTLNELLAQNPKEMQKNRIQAFLQDWIRRNLGEI